MSVARAGASSVLRYPSYITFQHATPSQWLGNWKIDMDARHNSCTIAKKNIQGTRRLLQFVGANSCGQCAFPDPKALGKIQPNATVAILIILNGEWCYATNPRANFLHFHHVRNTPTCPLPWQGTGRSLSLSRAAPTKRTSLRHSTAVFKAQFNALVLHSFTVQHILGSRRVIPTAACSNISLQLDGMKGWTAAVWCCLSLHVISSSTFSENSHGFLWNFIGPQTHGQIANLCKPQSFPCPRSVVC